MTGSEPMPPMSAPINQFASWTYKEMVNTADRDLLDEAQVYDGCRDLRLASDLTSCEDVSIERLGWSVGAEFPGFRKLETRSERRQCNKRRHDTTGTDNKPNLTSIHLHDLPAKGSRGLHLRCAGPRYKTFLTTIWA
jgi:hypothetical protein